MPDDEEWLAGGNMNAVQRIGETVHRRSGPWTPTIHRLLDHLHSNGIDWVPRAIGFDDGREVLSYLPGVVPTYPLPSWVWDDAVLVSAVEHLADFHDATADFANSDGVWQIARHEPSEVVCHNDFAPYNMVFDDRHELTGVIDCDTASPGPRVWDLAYLAYRLVPLTGPLNLDTPGFDPSARSRRLDLLCQTYRHATTPDDVITTAVARLHDLAAFSDARAPVNPELATHAQMYRDDAAWLQDHQHTD
jgi:aminoglycoside phosphotransferase (APT) family kinase protein